MVVTTGMDGKGVRKRAEYRLQLGIYARNRIGGNCHGHIVKQIVRSRNQYDIERGYTLHDIFLREIGQVDNSNFRSLSSSFAKLILRLRDRTFALIRTSEDDNSPPCPEHQLLPLNCCTQSILHTYSNTEMYIHS